jgi:hypothetical protein
MPSSPQLRSLRIWLSVFIVGLVLSGITAFPLVHETAWLARLLDAHPVLPSGIILWIDRVSAALADQSARYPFLAYGTDWLAFAHLVLAVVFLGPLTDPIRNKWVLQFGLIACAGVFALALIAGSLRGIPPLWRLIDCSFGLFGAIPLLVCLRRVHQIELAANLAVHSSPQPTSVN